MTTFEKPFENIVGKGKIAGNQHFLLFLQFFLNAVFNRISVISCSQGTYPCFPGVLLTSTPHNILSKPLAASQHNHCLNNGQGRERNESCCNDYHQSSERKSAVPAIELATFCYQVCNATNGARGLGNKG